MTLQIDYENVLGAKWDRQEKSWYVPIGVDLVPFAKWEKPAVIAETDEPKVAISTESQVENQKLARERQYLAVPYGESAAAKASGAIWDKAAKFWYVGPDGDMENWGSATYIMPPVFWFGYSCR